MIDKIANIFLLFSNDAIIIPLIILGFIWKDHDIFYRAVYLILFSMIFNTALKVTFQIPLSPLLDKEGFAFPSGHMQSSVVFYTWIAYNIQNLKLSLLTIILLIGIGCSLVYLEYHNYFDIFGAIFFAAFILTGYYLLEYKFGKYKNISEAVLLITSTVIIIYISVCISEIPGHVWLAYYALIGFIGSLKLLPQQDSANSWLQKLLASVLCFFVIFLINMAFRLELFTNLPLFLSQLPWFLIGFIIPCSNFIANILIKQNVKNAIY